MPQYELIPSNGVFSRRVLPALLCLNVLLLLFFLFFNYQLVFHSDSAVKNLLAQEIYETGQYFPRDWNYINSDLWVFYTHTFVLLLLPLIPNGFAAHALSDLISAALILGGSWCLAQVLGQGRPARLLSLILLSSGMSLILAEHIFGQAAYGSMYYMACYLLYSYWSLLQASGRRRWLWAGATFVLTALVFWANPQRALIYYGLPLITAAAALQLADWNTGGPRRLWPWVLVAAAGVLAGTGLHVQTTKGVNISSGLTAMNWLDFNGIQRNILGTLAGLLNLFDGLPRTQTKVVSGYGAYQVLRMLTALAMLVVLPYTLCKAVDPRQRGRLFVAAYTLAALGTTLLFTLTTTLADMSSPEGSVRYLVPPLLLMLVIMVGMLLEGKKLHAGMRMCGLAAVAVLSTSGVWAYLSPYTLSFGLPPSVTLPHDALRLGNFLADNKLYYGYASFWSAGKLSVLTEQRVRVRQIQMEHGMPMPMRMLSSNRWYRPEAWQGETFLLLKDSEVSSVNLALLSSQAGAPTRTLHFEGWTVIVFAGNLAKLAAWDREALAPVRYTIQPHTPHLVGKIRGEPAVLAAEPEEYGPLYFGPAGSVLKGSYRVSFDLEASGAAGQEYGTVDVVSQGGNAVHARQAIRQQGRHTLTLEFSTPGTIDPLELRVLKSGGSKLILHGVELRNARS